jgi:hypothetical protein
LKLKYWKEAAAWVSPRDEPLWELWRRDILHLPGVKPQFSRARICIPTTLSLHLITTQCKGSFIVVERFTTLVCDPYTEQYENGYIYVARTVIIGNSCTVLVITLGRDLFNEKEVAG